MNVKELKEKFREKTESCKKKLLLNAVKIVGVICSVMLTVSMSTVNIAAAPADVDTKALDKMIDVVFWVARIIIVAVGGIPAGVKIVQGQADENSRDRNAGIAGLVVTGLVFGVTFAISALIADA